MATATKKKLIPHKMTYTGKGGELFKMWLVNLLLTIPTLGIYRFWAKAKIRKYQASHLDLNGSTFEHTGNGKELFLGFLKVIGVVLLLFLLPIVFEILGLSFLTFLAYALIYVSFLFLLPVAYYAGFRYLSSRTSWKGIRGYLGGSAFKYGGLALWRGILNVVSLGLLKPKSDIVKHAYVMKHLQFGTEKLEFKGDAKGLMKPYLLQYLLFIIPLVLGILIGGVLKGQELIRNAEKKLEAEKQYEGSGLSDPVMHFASFEGKPKTKYSGNIILAEYSDSLPEHSDELTDEEFGQLMGHIESSMGSVAVLGMAGGYLLVLYILFPLLGLLIVAPYQAALTRKKFAGLKLDELRFKNTITSGAFIRHYVVNMLIFVFTLSFGRALIWKRNMIFMCDHLVIGGDLDGFTTSQAEKQKASAGESLGDAMDIDGGFDIGL